MGSLPEVGCGQKVIRWLFIIFNIIFSLVGLALVIAGSYGVAKVKSQSFNELQSLLPENDKTDDDVEVVRAGLVGVAGVIITVGLVTLLISSCGWIGACKQNTCLLFTFSVFMVIIVLLELILGIVGLVVVKKLNDENDSDSKKWVNEIIEKGKEAFNQSTPLKPLAKTWKLIQSEGKCCGIRGPEDWGDYLPLVEGCEDPDGKTYKEGCLDVYENALKSVSSALGGVAITFCLIEIFGIVLSCYLAFSMRKGSQYEQH